VTVQGAAGEWPAAVAAVIDWFQAARLPARFVLRDCPKTVVVDGPVWQAAVIRDSSAGPRGPRARYGAVQRDWADVFRQFGAGADHA
jgi:hypothetical protein